MIDEEFSEDSLTEFLEEFQKGNCYYYNMFTGNTLIYFFP